MFDFHVLIDILDPLVFIKLNDSLSFTKSVANLINQSFTFS